MSERISLRCIKLHCTKPATYKTFQVHNEATAGLCVQTSDLYVVF
jgi:hypothetical protein